MAAINEHDLEFARQALRIRLSAVLLDGLSAAVYRGETYETIAARLGWSREKLVSVVLDPLKLTIEGLSDISVACGFEITLSLRDKFSPQADR
jgi:hypothetical protein